MRSTLRTTDGDIAEPLQEEIVAVRLPDAGRPNEIEVLGWPDSRPPERRVPDPFLAEARRLVLRVPEVHQIATVGALEQRIARPRSMREKIHDPKVARRLEILIAYARVPAVYAPKQIVGASEDRMVGDEVPVSEDAEQL
jgi:hypothetical protein